MAITANKGTEKVVGGRENYCGLGTFRLVSVNPTKEELKSVIGFNDPKEPIYLSEETNEDGSTTEVVRIDFYMKEVNTDVPVNHSFYVRNNVRTSKDGKVQYTNNYAQFTYVKESDYFNPEGIRPALNGEEDLMRFISDLTNQRKGRTGDKLYIENWPAIFTGNFSEIREIKNVLDQTNTIGILIGIRTAGDGKQYMTGYKSAYIRPTEKIGKLINALNNEYTQFKYDYMNDFEFKVYTNVGPTTQAESAGTTAITAWG